MKKIIPNFQSLVFLLWFIPAIVFAQGPGSLFVDAGPDVFADCAAGGCADITATFLETFDTSGLTYSVSSVPYNPPFAFNGLANQLNPNIDDAWSNVDNLPFDFCFFGNLETQFQVGSNGVLRFDVDPGDTGPGSNGWSFSQNLPNNSNPTLGEANVFTPGHDIDPAVSSSEEIGYEVLGTFPNRVLVVSYYRVPMYSAACNSLLATHMAVFYEFSNVIEIYMQDKPSCPTWNGGNAVLGIQNNAGTTAYVPLGRNTSDSPWTATNESWSFSPVGPPTYVFEWLDSTGTVIGNTPTINVCPSGASETFTARVTWTNTCNGEVVTLTDEVVVTQLAPYSIDLGPDVDSCGSDPVILDADPGLPNISYEWFYNGISQGPSAVGNSTFVVNPPNSGTYSVETFDLADPTCIIGDSIEINFLIQPNANAPMDLFQCDDGTNTGVFDLTVNDAIVLGGQNPAEFNITYHNSALDAGTGANPIATPAAYPITGTVETIHVRIEDLTGVCFDTDSFIIEFSPATAGPMTDIEVCDQDSNGIVTLNLVLLKNAEALNGQNPSSYTVSYHPTQADADANTNPHPNPYDVTAPSETIFVRVESNTNTTCYATDSFDVTIYVAPLLTTPTPLEACDDLPNDGFAIFDLTSKEIEITGGNPDAVVLWFTTFTAAQTGGFPIANPMTFANTVQGFQTVYARVEHISSSSCFNIVALDLVVNDSPALTDPISDYFLCDNDGDGIEVFDLTSKDAEILNFLVNVDLTYHVSQADADAGNAPITPADVYPSGNAVIWVRGENVAGCYTVRSFNLVLGSVPNFVVVPEFFQCDDELADGFTQFDLNTQNATIVNGDPNLSVGYYASQGDADTAMNPLSIPYTNMSNPETIYVRVEDNITGCYGIFPMDLIVVEAPEIFVPDPLIYCDFDNDGFGEFTLTDADEDVVGGNPSGSLVVSYHRTLADSQNGVNPLVSPYNNVDPFNQTVYVRLVDLSTGCYNLTTLELIVEDSPQIGDPLPLVVCDDDGDGFAIFDLTLVEPELYAGLDPADYTTSYYDDPGLTVLIANPTVYPNTSNPQTIYIVVQDIVNGCEAQTTVDLQVNLPPTIFSPTPLELCDQNNPGDEMEAFDLNSKILEITGGNLSIMVTFHLTQGDADTGANPLVSPYVNTVPQPQTIYIRAQDSGTSCIVSQGYTLDLVVNPVPSPITPTPLEVCDDDNDGFASFDLSSKTAEIIGGEPFVSVTYHENITDANTGASPLASPYFNIVANLQTVYARAIYGPLNPPPNNTGCYRVVALDLVVISSPIVPIELDPLVICDDDGDGLAQFDLTERAADIYGFQDPADYGLSYHLTMGDADAGINAIGNPTTYTNVSNPQSIYIRLESNDTGCYTVRDFELQVSIGPSVSQATDYTLCDDLGQANDGVTEFDLTIKDDEITGGVLGVEVYYYVSQQDADDDLNRIIPASSYTNVSNPQTIFARVLDTNTECYTTSINFELRVLSNPQPNTPDPIELCDVNDPGDGVEVFDLTIRESQITVNPNYVLSYHESYQDAVDNTPLAGDPLAYPNVSNPQTIYVRVTNPLSSEGCFEIVELVLIVNALPDDTAVIEDMIVCEIGSDGIAIFDLTTKEAEILNGQDPAIHQVSFYEDPLDAAGGLNPIGNTVAYESDGSVSPPGQAIYVGILNTDTGCYTASMEDIATGSYSLSFHLQVLEGAVANPPLGPYVLCDEVAPNDGYTEFDLSILGLEILAGQPYTVDFYESFELADQGDTATALPNLYTNIINPQIIYARVTHPDTGCYDITQAILKVEQLPEITLDETYRLCVDENGNPIAQEEGADSPPVIDTGLDPAIYTFAWQLNGSVLLGEVGAFITALQAGEYSVTITEIATGCSSSASTTVIESGPPTEYSAEVLSGAFAGTHVIDAQATGLGVYVFQLDDGAFVDNGLFEDVDPGVHTITIKDALGCGSVVLEVSIIDYPQFVTPNGDGYHDTWNIIGIAGGDPTAKIYIFDRFGKLLKQLSPLGPGWDGTYNGNPLPSSDYWFLVEYTEDQTAKEFKGHFTLKR